MPERFPRSTIQTGNIERRLRAAYGIKGKSVVPNLGDQLHPVTVIDDLAHPLWYDETDIRRSFSSHLVAPVVGQSGYVTIVNPAGSGVLIFLESAWVIGAAGASLIGRLTGAEPAGVEVGFHYDDRLGLFTTATRLRSGTNAALQIASAFIKPFEANVTRRWEIGAVLSPGGLGWAIQHGTQNQQLDCGFQWQERPLSP